MFWTAKCCKDSEEVDFHLSLLCLAGLAHCRQVAGRLQAGCRQEQAVHPLHPPSLPEEGPCVLQADALNQGAWIEEENFVLTYGTMKSLLNY